MAKISVIDTGLFKLDGGAMFGVVPQQLWKKLNPPDENNMCTWAMRCLLIEEGEKKILVDTGLGFKQDEKFRSHFEPHGEDSLIGSISKINIDLASITDVLLTHFHFDHIGGAVSMDQNQNYFPTFPNATYWTNEAHYRWASDPNPREKASFLRENFIPLKEANKLKFIDIEQDIHFTDDISIKFVYGHTEAMMLPMVKMDDGRTLAYCADLIPSIGHINLPYVMAYDIRPLETMKEKASFTEEALSNDYILMLEHDPTIECIQLGKSDKGRIMAKQSGKLTDWYP